MKHTKFENPEIKKVYERFPKEMKTKVLEVREIIFEVGKNNEKITKITETLKWGEPTYQRDRSKYGSPIKINYKKTMENHFSISVISSTNLIQKIKELYPKAFEFNGDREIIINANKKLPKNEIYKFIELALTHKFK
jgi:hypothetical protein